MSCIIKDLMYAHDNSITEPQKCQYAEDNVLAMLALLRLNIIDNLCSKAWPRAHFIDSFLIWMWYLAEERCLLLAPHVAILSLYIFKICPSPRVCPQTHWSLGGSSEFIRVITVNTVMCVCIFERLLFFARWGAGSQGVKRVIRVSTCSVCSLDRWQMFTHTHRGNETYTLCLQRPQPDRREESSWHSEAPLDHHRGCGTEEHNKEWQNSERRMINGGTTTAFEVEWVYCWKIVWKNLQVCVFTHTNVWVIWRFHYLHISMCGHIYFW